MAEEGEHASERRNAPQTSTGITLLGVLLSIALTIGFGVPGVWWARVLAGGVAAVVLAVVVKLGTRSSAGPLARLAAWFQNAP